MGFNTIKWQFEGRRKPEEFVLYVPDEEGNVVIQSDKSIAQINLRTGKGLLNAKGGGGKYFHDLAFASEVQFPKALVDLVKKSVPKSGDVISEEHGVVWG